MFEEQNIEDATSASNFLSPMRAKDVAGNLSIKVVNQGPPATQTK